jgi:UDP-2,3-diacylglucosamine pyrophosphatase LpxH
MLKAYFLSDLHWLSERSSAPSYMPSIHRAASQAHTMILGGDIFDFRWSHHASLQQSIDDSVRWLSDLIHAHSQCRFHYLLGNHDCHPDFVAALDRLSFAEPRLAWQPHWLRIDNCVFLHGDVLDGGLDHDELERSRRKMDDKKSPLPYRHWLYNVVVRSRIHRVVATVAKPHASVLKKLSRYLREQGQHSDQGISDVYFGHTHRAMESWEYDGMSFHNSGAFIKGIPHKILRVNWRPSRIES